jgi:ribosomal protein L31E
MAKFEAGTQRDYVISLKEATNRSFSKKANKAVLTVKRFIIKHTRNPNIVLTEEVNHFLWQNGKFKVPKKIDVTLKENGGRVLVYLKGSKRIQEDLKKAEAKKEEKKSMVEQAKEKAKGLEEEQKKKLADKKAKEKASETAAMKKGQK